MIVVQRQTESTQDIANVRGMVLRFFFTGPYVNYDHCRPILQVSLLIDRK